MIYWNMSLHNARLAQSVERWTLNPTVVGSSPTLGVIFIFRGKFTQILKMQAIPWFFIPFGMVWDRSDPIPIMTHDSLDTTFRRVAICKDQKINFRLTSSVFFDRNNMYFGPENISDWFISE